MIARSRSAQGLVAALATVSDSTHWSLKETSLNAGDVFGYEQKIIGFECDGLDVTWPEHGRTIPPDPVLTQHTTIVAWVDCSDWSLTAKDLEEVPYGAQGRDVEASMGGMVTMVRAQHGRDEALIAPVIDWAHTLVDLEDYTGYQQVPRPVKDASGANRQIDRNVLPRFAEPGHDSSSLEAMR